MKAIELTPKGTIYHIKSRREINNPAWEAKVSQMQWADYLDFFSNLPEMVLGAVSPAATVDNSKVIKDLKHHYKTIAEWLRWLRPGDKPHTPELFFTEKINVKPYAELSIKALDLIIELYPRSEWLQNYFVTPVDCWFRCEMQSCRFALEDSGLITGIPNPKGKVAWYDDVQKVVGENASFEKWPLHFGKASSATVPLTWESNKEFPLSAIIFLLAAEKAKTDLKFRNGNCFMAYKRAMRAWSSHVRRNKELTRTYLQDGELLPTGKHKKLPKQGGSGKGFVTKSLQKKR
jgi:hypothetical protein